MGRLRITYSPTHFFTPPFLLLRAPRGGPINVPQKSSPKTRTSARLTRRFSRFLPRNGWEIGREFCVFDNTDNRRKSRKIHPTASSARTLRLMATVWEW